MCGGVFVLSSDKNCPVGDFWTFGCLEVNFGGAFFGGVIVGGY